MKKILSVLLVVTLLLTSVSTGLLGFAGYTPDKSKAIVTLKVSPDAKSYKWGDEIVFNVSATNNTEQDYENVKIRASANKTKFFYDGESNTVKLDELKAGETQEVQIKVASSKPNILQQLFILPIYYILDFLAPLTFKASNFDATTLVKVGAFKYKFGFDVTDGTIAEEKQDKPVDPAETFTVSFDLNYEGSENTIPAQTINAGELVQEVQVPSRNGFEFVGWYTNADCNDENSFSFLIPVNSDLTLFAKWNEAEIPTSNYTVSFDLNYEGAATIPSQTVAAGRTVRAVADPTRENYGFIGWFTDASCEEEFRFSFNNAVNSNLTLYAKWQANSGNEPILDDPNTEVEIYSFDTDTYDILINTETTVCFTAEVFSDETLEDDAVYIIDENNNLIGYMNDSGTDGDEEAEDGIYTLVTVLSSETVKIVKYYVVIGEVQSEYLPISYYKHITEDEMEELSAIQAEIDTLMGTYLDEDGYLIEAKYDDAIRAITEKLNALKDSGSVVSFTVNKNNYNVEIVARSGLDYYYTFSLRNSDVGSSTSVLMSYQPYKGDSFHPYDSFHQGLSDDATDGSGRYVANAIDSYIFNSLTSGNEQNSLLDSNHDREEVSIESLKHLAAADVVTWHGHGGYSANKGSFMATGSFFNNDLEADWQANRIVVCDNNRVAITGEFIRKYVGDLTGKFVYLGTCSSGEDLLDNVSSDSVYELGKAFADKGATVIANSGTISTAYNCRMERSIFERLATISDVSNKYYSLAEALEYAKQVNGSNDNRNGDGTGTFAFIYPYTSTARGYKLKESNGSLSGIIKSSTNNNPVSNALVRVYKNNALVTNTRTDANGKYTLDLPAGEYVLKISAGQYKAASVLTTVVEGRVSYVETFLLVKSSQTTGTASGRTIDAIDGYRIQDVTIKVRRNWNNKTGAVLTTLSSDSNGLYELNFTAGYYTLECSKEGYVTAYKSIIVSTNDTLEQNVSITPVLSDGDYRVVLTWGENPSDLDSHLFGSNADGSTYHVYFSSKDGYNAESELVANLDVDDTTSYGPETTTFTTNANGTYEFYVDWYSGSGTWATSGGKVEVYSGDHLLGTYYVPNVENRAGSWKVFSIANGVYTAYNIIQEQDIY